MKLVQLLYVSKRVGTSIDKLPDVINVMRNRNIETDISSVVLSDGTHYLHVIEGHLGVVNQLYNRIVNDPKHIDCTLLKYYEIPHREFSDFPAEIVNLSSICYANTQEALILPSENGPVYITPSRALTLLRRVVMNCRLCGKNTNTASECNKGPV